MEAKSVRNMQSNIAVTNKHTAKLHHVGSLYILTYDARKLKHKISRCILFPLGPFYFLYFTGKCMRVSFPSIIDFI